MKRVIFDTNFLLIPAQFKVDIFSEVERIMDEPFELHVLEGTMRELKGLSQGNSKDAQAAKLGYVLVQQKGLKMLDSSVSNVDDALVRIADENVVVATQDIELKKRLKKKGAKIITLRKKQYLVLEG